MIGTPFSIFEMISVFLFSGLIWDFKIPGIYRDWDLKPFDENPMEFKIPEMKIYFSWVVISHEKATSGLFDISDNITEKHEKENLKENFRSISPQADRARGLTQPRSTASILSKYAALG